MTSHCLAPASTAGFLLDPALLDLIPGGGGGGHRLHLWMQALPPASCYEGRSERPMENLRKPWPGMDFKTLAMQTSWSLI